MNDVERRVVAGVAARLEQVFYETMPDAQRETLRRSIGELRDFAELDRLPWPRWIKRAARRGDMDPELELRLMREDDGDVLLELYGPAREPDTPTASTWISAIVQFCTGRGGGRSPAVHRALCDLMVAIEADNAEHPQPK